MNATQAPTMGLRLTTRSAGVETSVLDVELCHGRSHERHLNKTHHFRIRRQGSLEPVGIRTYLTVRLVEWTLALSATVVSDSLSHARVPCRCQSMSSRLALVWLRHPYPRAAIKSPPTTVENIPVSADVPYVVQHQIHACSYTRVAKGLSMQSDLYSWSWLLISSFSKPTLHYFPLWPTHAYLTPA